MASVKHSLMVVLSSLLVTGGYSLPSLRLLFQDGIAGNVVEARSLRAESPLVATGRWEWMTAREAGHKSPLPRRKRDVVFPTNSSLVTATLLEDETDSPFVDVTPETLEEDETTQPGWAGNHSSAEVTTTSSAFQETSTEAVAVHLSTRYEMPLRKRTTTSSLSEDFTETRSAQDGHRSSHTSVAPSQASGATSATPAATLGPGAKSGVKTAGNTSSRPPSTVQVRPSLLPPGTSSRPPSTVQVRPSLSPPGASSRPPSTVQVRPSLLPPGTSSRPPSTVQVRPPSREAPQGPDRMVGQCLLAISLLALVAAIFIITTFVLIGLLLRQKRAYKLRQRNKHTEMVCISSLLAAEEAEASRGRASRAKRVKMLPENGSETDIDNLTLNSFLPDH